MGRFHADTLRNLGYRVTTVDPRPDAGAMRLDVPVGVYYSAAVVAVPIKHLAEVSVDIERICERLLIEKPGAASANEMARLRDFIGASRPAVGYTERWNPIVQAIIAGSTRPQRAQTTVKMVRWGTRPSPDIWLDLVTHDVDLVRFLGFGHAEYSTKANYTEMVRRIETVGPAWGERAFDLCAHRLKPLFAQWHNFMGSRSGMCSLTDALHVLERVEELRETGAAPVLEGAA
jgi:hypothetical protein